ncbi:hypothetical protein ER308_08830 [Egibacter rhizosphaerae]|uniref:Uncharacterized protein n=1 Tax=Egibacter rhizosphaerae TaxID=1670831 RepID=A0A411YEJ6_9ACTN|nr:hypothetical protein [Egibacter rhizosphaerae]QBI19645.1 hypothetical protein ER308_08830 [Egibacter rhizosphaerae]
MTTETNHTSATPGEVADAPGWQVDWLNAWLAAIGLLWLEPAARVAWSTDPVPHARLHAPGSDPASAIAEALPDLAALQRLAIASEHPSSSRPFKRNPSLDDYRARAALARADHDFSLSVSVTDLTSDASRELPHSPLDPPAPKGQTLWDRLVRVREKLDAQAPNTVEAAARSLQGVPTRVQANGLGFDVRRIDPAAGGDELTVDPIVECLALFGLALLPIRGDGVRPTTRGWRGPALRGGSFRWPAWSDWLDVWAVDGLLDRCHAAAHEAHRIGRWGVAAVFETVPYQPTGQSDVRRGYASRRLW